MNTTKIYYFFLSLLLVISSLIPAQVTLITIGTGTTTNSTTTYPAPYGNWYFGAKHQMIVRAQELTNAGMSAGNIQSLAFQVATIGGTPLTGFTIKMGNTTKNAWNNNDNFIGSLTTVFNASSYSDISGWNTHTFSNPFYWDGTSNLIIETCFNNTNFTQNAAMFFSTTTGNTVAYNFQDASGVCGLNQISGISDGRPNMRFGWQTPNLPPITNFNASATSTCSGIVSFTDASTFSPTSWLWDFGDGNQSTAQNPTHTYTTSGTYTVTLTTTNAFGSDVEVKTNYITVNLTGGFPISACIPNTQNGSLNFGPTNVTFNTINKSSTGGSAGYADYTCDQTTVFAGFSYPFSVTHSTPTFHNCRAWIDWNNDGVFNPTTELIASSNSSNSTSATVVIPSNAVLNMPLRMRVIADYDLSADPTPCGNPEYGQAEDYTVFVEQNAAPPTANFTSNVIQTCDGTVNFTDLSTNIPNAWSWEFGDGGISVLKNPTHTYTVSGTYTVQLISINNFGQDTIIQNNFITVDLEKDLVDATCEPQTLGECCGYGIYKVVFNTINHSTAGSIDGYQDYSCEKNTVVNNGQNYAIEVRTGTLNPQDTKVYIDFNNNGTFEGNELVYTKLNAYNPNGVINIPSTNVTFDTYLRMRVQSDEVGGTIDGCGNHLRGQTEDYGVKINGPISVEEISTVNFVVFPNPTEGMISIESQKTIESIIVYNLIGEQVTVLNALNTNTLSQIDVSELAKGVYIIELTTTSGLKAAQKLIIK